MLIISTGEHRAFVADVGGRHGDELEHLVFTLAAERTGRRAHLGLSRSEARAPAFEAKNGSTCK